MILIYFVSSPLWWIGWVRPYVKTSGRAIRSRFFCTTQTGFKTLSE
jgi:hypothetical protein